MAKVFDAKAIQGSRGLQGIGRQPAVQGVNRVDVKLDSLSRKVDKMIELQDHVCQRLDNIHQNVKNLDQEVEVLKNINKGHPSMCIGEGQQSVKQFHDITVMLRSMCQESENQGNKIEEMENKMSNLQLMLSYLEENLKESKIAEFTICEHSSTKDEKVQDDVKKSNIKTKCENGQEPNMQVEEKQEKKWNEKCISKERTPNKPKNDTVVVDQQTETSSDTTQNCTNKNVGVSEILQEEPKESNNHFTKQCCRLQESIGTTNQDSTPDRHAQDYGTHSKHSDVNAKGIKDAEQNVKRDAETFALSASDKGTSDQQGLIQPGQPTTVESQSENTFAGAASSTLCKQREQQKEVKVNDKDICTARKGGNHFYPDGNFCPSTFSHRVVTTKMEDVLTYYTLKPDDILGGGRFGQVQKCVDKETEQILAAKIIMVKEAKAKDKVRNEIYMMNHLKHSNLVQLYDAFESKNEFVLIMEYVQGGELFDCIGNEDRGLTELDVSIFVWQICQGLQYMHQQYILHLNLKPENILCLDKKGNRIKIIDFGLARRYKPHEKLKVHGGIPEFLAPEVVNYDNVTFSTDMWSVGVITYMLLSGLSPFMGANDNETLNNIARVRWDFEHEAFENIVSNEAKDFISKLLVEVKSGRMSASQCMRHEWFCEEPGEQEGQRNVHLKSQTMLHNYVVQHRWNANEP
uniref:myosin light chain kinase 3-like n=1 Tax=Myxine glutinosa TaxID=7769 RepID=UPI00358ED547